MRVLRKRRTLALTGAGVSTWAGYGIWSAAIGHLAQAVQERNPGVDTAAIVHNNQNPLHCAERLGEQLGPGFGDFILKEFGPNSKRPDDVLFTLCRLPFRHFLTLNIDCSLEQIHTILKLPCVTVTTSYFGGLTKFMRVQDEDGIARHVCHFHGTYFDPIDQIALTNSGYKRLYHDGSLFFRFLWWLVTSQTLLFLGFGFTDSDFLQAIRRAAIELPGEDPVHFAVRGIGHHVNDEAIRNESNDSYKIDPIFYEIKDPPENPHAGFADLIRKIADELQIQQVAIPPLSAEEMAPAPEPADVQRAKELGASLVERLDPGGDNVPH